MKKQKINQELVKKIMEKKGLTKSEAKAWLDKVILSNKELSEISGGVRFAIREGGRTVGAGITGPRGQV